MILAWVTIIAQCLVFCPLIINPAKLAFPFHVLSGENLPLLGKFVAVFSIPEDVSLLSGASEILCAE